MTVSTLIGFAFSVLIIVQGALYISKRTNEAGKIAGIILIIGGVLFVAATAMGLMQSGKSLLMIRWILYIVGLILVIVGAIKNKNASSK